LPQVTNLDEYTPLQVVTNFATLVSTYSEGFQIIYEVRISICLL